MTTNLTLHKESLGKQTNCGYIVGQVNAVEMSNHSSSLEQRTVCVSYVSVFMAVSWCQCSYIRAQCLCVDQLTANTSLTKPSAPETFTQR